MLLVNVENTNGFSDFSDLSNNISIDHLVKTIKYHDSNISSIHFYNNTIVNPNKKKNKQQNKDNIDTFDYPFGKVLLALLNYFPNLRQLIISGINLSLSDLDSLTHYLELAKLLVLDLTNCYFDDFSLSLLSESLTKNKFLIEIKLENIGINSKNGHYINEILSKNNITTKYYLSKNEFNGVVFRKFLTILNESNKIRNVKLLDISYNKLDEDDLICIGECLMKNTDIETINLSGNKFTSDSMEIIQKALKDNEYSKVRVCYLNNISLNEELSFMLLQNFNNTNLVEFYLDNNDIGDTGIIIFTNFIKNNKNLTKLSLNNTNISSHTFICFTKAIEINEKLTEVFYLNNDNLDSKTITMIKDAVENKPNNFTFYLSLNKISNKDMEIIQGIKQIKLC